MNKRKIFSVAMLLACSFSAMPLQTMAQTQQNAAVLSARMVQGVVTDADGETLPAASVKVKGTNIVVLTDADGRFKLPLNNTKACVLEISYIGMSTKEVQVSAGKSTVQVGKVALYEDHNNLGEVVVTGIFKKAKESYTGSVSTVTKEQLQMYRSQNLLQTLKNVDVSINMMADNLGGSDPNSMPNITIRGNSSLPTSVEEYNNMADNSVNTPLIILDGFEISLERLKDYNSDEIESINILKDAASTAIYGSRGSNGVIVVITKQPEAGKLRVTAEVGVNLEVPDLTSYDLLNAAEKLQLEYDLGLYSSSSPSSDMDYKEAYARRLREVAAGTNVDWLSKPLQVGAAMRYGVRLEGGSKQFRWGVSGSYNDTSGAMKGSSRKSFNGGITLMYNVKNLIFRNYTSFGLTSSTESKYGSFSEYSKQQPYNNPYDENGNLVRRFEHFSGSLGHRNNGTANPLYNATLNTFNIGGSKTLTNNFSIEWRATDEFTLRAQVGVSDRSNTRDYFLPAEHTYFLSDAYTTSEGFLRRGSYDYTTGGGYSLDGSITASYSKVFADKHQLYVGFDGSMREYNSKSYTFRAEGFMDSDIHNIANARQYAEASSPTGSTSTTRNVGLATNINYIYNNRYYTDISIRMDGNSSFGTKKKFGTFWSTGIGWNVHNEKFMKNLPFSSLRLKASYGQTGSPNGSEATRTLYNILNNSYYMNWVGAQMQNMGNPYLTWQTTNEFNAGIEFGVLDNRLRGEFNIYNKVTGNLLSNMDLPAHTGFSSYADNIGEVKNSGWEASASYYIIRNHNKQLTWLVSGQLAYNKNMVTKLSDAIKQQTAEYLATDKDVATLFYEGRPQNGIYVVRSLGIDPSNGQEIFLDKDGNRTDVWKPSDKVYVGQQDPVYRGIISNMVMWKGFTLNVSAGFHWGGMQYNSTLLNRVEVGRDVLTTQNVDRRTLTERWLQPGDVKPFKKFGNESTKASSRFVMKDDVFQIQSVSLQYRWDNAWVRKHLQASSITFGLNMNDLLYVSTIKRERGLDYPFARNIQGSVKFIF